MKKSLLLIGVLSVLSMGIHLYLSHRSHALSSGSFKSSLICPSQSSLSCDKTLISPYSQIGKIPLSTWGFAAHLIMFLLIFTLLIGWSEKQNLLLNLLKIMVVLSALASLGMLMVSVFVLNSFCLLCCLLYLISFVVLWLGRRIGDFKTGVLQGLTQSGRVAGLALGGYFAFTFLTHAVFLKIYDNRSVQKMSQAYFQDWLNAPFQQIQGQALLSDPVKKQSLPPSSPSLVLTEFADFLCSHCKTLHQLLQFLKKTWPSLSIQYFSFPLNSCKGNYPSCLLTRAVYCAKLQNQGWQLQDIIYSHQKSFFALRDQKQILTQLKKLSVPLSLNFGDLEKCIPSPEAGKVLKDQIQAGKQMNIKGTPTLFVNGRKLQWQYLFETLKLIHKHLKQTGGDDKQTLKKPDRANKKDF